MLDCLQQILLQIADDLTQYRSPGAMSVIRRLLTGDCLKAVLGQMQNHSRVPHIKAALRLLSTMTSVSDVAAREVMTHFEALQPALLRFLYRKSVSDLLSWMGDCFAGGYTILVCSQPPGSAIASLLAQLSQAIPHG